jgi:hypothetical protein
MAENSLVMPFLDHDPKYAHGVEFGMLYVRMRDGGEGVIGDYFLADNEDQILLAGGRLS